MTSWLQRPSPSFPSPPAKSTELPRTIYHAVAADGLRICEGAGGCRRCVLQLRPWQSRGWQDPRSPGLSSPAPFLWKANGYWWCSLEGAQSSKQREKWEIRWDPFAYFRVMMIFMQLVVVSLLVGDDCWLRTLEASVFAVRNTRCLAVVPSKYGCFLTSWQRHHLFV